MAFLPRPVTMMMLVRPAATASSITYWMIGLSTRGSISFGCALVAGRKRVPRPAAGNTALRMRAIVIDASTAPARARAIVAAPRAGRAGTLRRGQVLDLRFVSENKDAVEAMLRE